MPKSSARREDLAVQAVDPVVLAHQVLGQAHVAGGERLLALDHQRAREDAHLRELVEQLLVGGGLVAGQRHQLGDVHALVAHALDVLDEVQQGRHHAQVAGHRGLKGEQREDALVDLQVAAVDAVVVGDHHARQLYVLVA